MMHDRAIVAECRHLTPMMFGSNRVTHLARPRRDDKNEAGTCKARMNVFLKQYADVRCRTSSWRCQGIACLEDSSELRQLVLPTKHFSTGQLIRYLQPRRQFDVREARCEDPNNI